MIQIDLSHRHALVCGGSKGIGKATAMALAEAGASVILVARDAKHLEDTWLLLPKKYGQHHQSLVADFNEPEDLQLKIHNLVLQQGVDILINNTGGPAGGLAHLAATEQFEKAFRQHLICNQILVQAVLPQMKEKKFGRIINVISTSVKQPLDNLGVSNTVRAAVANWAKTLANELAAFQITVNNILPGATKTDRLEQIIAKEAEAKNLSESEISKHMLQSIPAGRFAAPEEIANAIVFLASPLANYITGINLPVDGGRTKCL